MNRKLVIVCAILLAFVSACGNNNTQSFAPVATITLAIPDPSNLPSMTRAQRISVGQTIDVRVERTDSAGYWQQVNPGNTAVLARVDTPAGSSSCPSGNVGCASTSDFIYRGAKAGQSYLVWHFRGLGPALHKPGQPSEPCPGDTNQECPVGSFAIDIEVV